MKSTTAPPVAATLGTLADIELDRKIRDRAKMISVALADHDRALDQVKMCERSAVLSAWPLGQFLTEKKGRLEHGRWLPWLESTGISSSSAADYMRLGREISSAGNLGPSIRATIRALSPPAPAVVEPGPADLSEPDSAAVITKLEADLYDAQERTAIMEEAVDPKSRKAIDKLNNQAELIKTLKASVADWQSKASAARKENASLKRRIRALENQKGARAI